MNELRYLVVTLLCLFLLLACQSKKEKLTEISHIEVNLADPEQDFKSIMCGGEIISLDTSDNGILTFVSKIICSKSHFFVLQIQTNEIFCYDDKGVFQYKIANRGNALHEYHTITDIDFCAEQNMLYLLDANRKIFLYSPEGELQKVSKLKNVQGTPMEILPVFSDSTIVLSRLAENNYSHSLHSDSSSTSLSHEKVSLSNNIYQKTESSIYYFNALQDQVFAYDRKRGDFTPYCELRFNLHNDNEYIVNTDRDIENELMEKGILIRDLHLGDDHLFLSIVVLETLESWHLIYDKCTRKTYRIRSAQFPFDRFIGFNGKFAYFLGNSENQEFKSIAYKLIGKEDISGDTSGCLENPFVVKVALK